ncbi:MAG: DUF6883 domain-containing protein [Chitinophagaceae bacterium]
MPNNEQSIVVDKKITEYLLSDSHEIGKHKANFFKRFGFDISDIETFKHSLIQHSVEREIEQTKNTEYGNKYELKCEFQTPDERNPCIVTVWIIENGKQKPTLITAYRAN